MPLSPDFQDPSPVQNYPPYFAQSPVPFFETTGYMPPQTFTVYVTDPNPGDLLYVRWASDYPLFTQADSQLLIDTMLPQQPQEPRITTITFDLSVMNSKMCIQKLTDGTAGPDHRLVVIVADRPFVPANLLTNAPEQRYNVTISGISLTMAGWSVTCPP